MATGGPTIRRPLPRTLRRRLHDLGRIWCPVVESSGLKEWSDSEVARLHPGWMRGFLRGHVRRCAVLALLYLLAFGFLTASFERYWHWVTTLEATAGESIKRIDQYKAFCAVKPWTRACRPAVRDDRTRLTAGGPIATLPALEALPASRATRAPRPARYTARAAHLDTLGLDEPALVAR